jgi:uncharacterized protein (DUF305 family)
MQGQLLFARLWRIAAIAILSLTLTEWLPVVDEANPPVVAQIASTCAPLISATLVPIVGPNATPSDDDPFDLQFIETMIANHAAAISLANVALQFAQDSDVRRMSLRIAESQAGEIQLLLYWRSLWYPSAAQDTLPAGGRVGQSLATPCAADGEFDRVFLELMIAQHRAAIMLAQRALILAEHSEILDFARTIIDARGAEIAMMTGWLTEMNVTQPVGTRAPGHRQQHLREVGILIQSFILSRPEGKSW